MEAISIGTTAIQLAKVMGCKVITTVADKEKLNFVAT